LETFDHQLPDAGSFARCLGQPPVARDAAFTISVENRVENLPRRQFFFGIPRRAADCTNMVRPRAPIEQHIIFREGRAAREERMTREKKNE
jgi:hypothetical protein